ncbi:MAG: leucyl aminopeptidase [Pseudanabaenaceae cyanobacterium bins.68]|nr:leucyl aminopeptidase [Pseudanabaenaceae cyanobacterium bins.68]
MSINIKASGAAAADWQGDGLAIAIFEQTEVNLPDHLQSLDQTALGGTLQELITEARFKGEANSSVQARIGGQAAIRKVILIGLGKPEQLSLETWRKAAAAATKWATHQRCATLAIDFPLNQDLEAIGAIAEGILLTSHKDERFKSKASQPEPQINLTDITLLGCAPEIAAPSLTLANQVVSGVILARELVSAPANLVTPSTLAETASAIAAEYGERFSVKILEQQDCEQLGMGAFLGVSQASDLLPKFIHLTYHPRETPQHKIAIVGKGLTFDSGGLNIKAGAGSSIELMKIDMAGSAATLGAAKVIGQIQPPGIEVHFIVAACENMISAKAMHPGDILTASNGKTIEVNNTDAEGRLTLADALVYADQLQLDAIVDLATLTGACIVALGESIGGLWSTNGEFAQAICQAAAKAGEKIWQMPLEDSYMDQLKSVVADYKNTGSRSGGAITGALFLKQFVANTPAWAHLDIAGPVWSDKENSYHNPGGTGYPVRTLVNLITTFRQ